MKNPNRILPLALALLAGALLLAGCDEGRQAKQSQESPARPARAESSDKSIPPPQSEPGRNWPDGPAPSSLAWLVHSCRPCRW